MGDPSFHRLICDFALAYPDVRIQVNASTRPVDLLKEGYDLALRAGTITEPGREAKRTWTMARPVKPSTSAPESSSSGVIHRQPFAAKEPRQGRRGQSTRAGAPDYFPAC